MNIVVFMRNASKTDYYLFLYSVSVEMIKFYTWRNCILHLEKKSSTLIEILLCTYRNFALHLEKFCSALGEKIFCKSPPKY